MQHHGDVSIETCMKHIFRVARIDKYLIDPYNHIAEIEEGMQNIKYLINIPIKWMPYRRSMSDILLYSRYIRKIRNTPIDNLSEIMTYVKDQLIHNPVMIGKIIQRNINNLLIDIISKSSIEYDISMAYLCKLLIKEVFIDGKHLIYSVPTDSINTPRTVVDSYRYTWNEKLIVFSYLAGRIPFLHEALNRCTKMSFSRFRSVDLSSSLKHARNLLRTHSVLSIVNGEICSYELV
jgi:hypothetical protein